MIVNEGKINMLHV